MITDMQDKLAVAKAAAKEILANAEGRELTATERKSFDAHIADGEAAAKLLNQRYETAAAIESLNAGTPVVGEPIKKLSVEAAVAKAVRKAFPDVKALGLTGEAALPAELLGGEVAEIPRESTFVSSLIPMKSVEDASTISFLQQTSRVNNAAPVAMGDEKSVSEFGVSRVDLPFETIAHLSQPVHRAHLADQRSLQSFMSAELVNGIMAAADDEVLNGTGTSPSLAGVLSAPGVLTQAFDTDVWATTRGALTQLQASGVNAGLTYVMSPADFAALELEQQGDHGFYYQGPVTEAASMLWGRPVLVSPSIADGQAVLGQFGESAEITTRGGIDLAWSEGHGTNFSHNTITMRAEVRMQVAVTRPSAFVSIALA